MKEPSCSLFKMCLAELAGTYLLFAVTDDGNPGAPPSGFAPVFIGLAAFVLISVIAPLTHACFNSARVFDLRRFACLTGWGTIALPGPRGVGFVSVYIVPRSSVRSSVQAFAESSSSDRDALPGDSGKRSRGES